VILLLVAFDLEGTLVDAEFFPEVGRRLGDGALLDSITRQAMNGELGFEEALLRRLKVIRGVPLEELREVCLRLPLFRGARETVRALRELRCTPAIITGGFDILADRVAAELGVEYVCANRFIVEHGRVVSVRRPIVTPEFKARRLLALARRLGVGPGCCVAVGDGANDIPMVEAAGLGIAFNAKRCVRERADVVIEGGDLREVLPYIIDFKEEVERLSSSPRPSVARLRSLPV